MHLQLLTGAGIVLLPGALVTAWWAIRNRKWGVYCCTVMGDWVYRYLLFRLPAYQHGRYLMPVMPVYFFMGLFGFYLVYFNKGALKKVRWLVNTAWGCRNCIGIRRILVFGDAVICPGCSHYRIGNGRYGKMGGRSHSLECIDCCTRCRRSWIFWGSQIGGHGWADFSGGYSISS